MKTIYEKVILFLKKFFRKIKVFFVSIYFIFSMILCQLLLRLGSKLPILGYKIKRFFFPFIRFLLEFRTLISLKIFLWHLFLFLLIIFSVVGVLFLSKEFSAYQNVFYTVLGAFLGLYMSYIISKSQALFEQIELMPLTVELISTGVLGGLFNIYEETIAFYPFDDRLCKNKSDIIYVSPVSTTIYFDEKKLQKYINFLGGTSDQILYEHFRPWETKNLIVRLKLLSSRLNSTYTSLIQYNKFINKDIFILFYQVVDMTQILFHFENKRWDSETQRKIVFSIKNMLFKMSCCIMLAQKEIKKYDKYSHYVTHSDENQKRIMIVQSSKIFKIYKEWLGYNLKKIAIFSKKERDAVLGTLVKIIKLKTSTQPPKSDQKQG